MRVLISEPLAEEGMVRLQQDCAVDYRPEMTAGELLREIGEYDGLVVRSATQVTAEVIRAGGRLKVIGRAGVGVNNIDLEAATQRGIVVLNVPDGNTIAACEHTLALMLAMARNIPDAVATLRSGKWERTRFTGVELNGKTLGVIGLGRIGTEVCKRAQSFNMRIVAFDPFASPAQAAKYGFRLASLEEVLAEADFLTVHAPLTAQTRNLIGAEQLAMMKSGARIVNCARGGIINEPALHDALAGGRIAAAAVDVFEKEPAPPDHPLLKLPNVIPTPHLGASTEEAQVACAVEVAEQIARFLTGQPVRNAVNLPAVSEQEWEELQPLLPLAEILGRLFPQALPGPLEVVEVGVHGELDARAADILGNTVLAGLLSTLSEDPVNQVNAPVVAKQRGIQFSLQRSHAGDGRASLIELRAGQAGRTRQVSGHLGTRGEPRIAEIDGLPLDLAPAAHMLLDFHEDKPGIIGRVGTILGGHGINIAAMTVGRHGAGEKAVMVLAVDSQVLDAVLDELRQVSGIREFRAVSLPPSLLSGVGPRESVAAHQGQALPRETAVS